MLETAVSVNEVEHPEQRFRSLVEQFFGDLKGKGINYSATYEIRKKITDYNLLDERTKMTIAMEIRQSLFHLPDALFVSDESMNRIENISSKYEYEYYSNPYQIKNGLPDWTQELLEERDSEEGQNILLCKDSGRVVGATTFEVDESELYISHQKSLPSYPGIGLFMLKMIKEKYDGSGLNLIWLMTAKIPRGLGNLGFEPRKVTNLREVLDDCIEYECSFQNRAEPERA